MLRGIGQGGRAEQELRRRAVQRTDALQPPEQAGHVRAKDPPVDVRLVEHHVAQVPKELSPARVLREDGAV